MKLCKPKPQPALLKHTSLPSSLLTQAITLFCKSSII